MTLALPRAATSSIATPDVTIGALTLYGTGASAPAGALQNLGTGLMTISTPGQVQVNGPVRLANLSGVTAGGLTIRAAGIDVVTPGGTIVQTSATGAPAGTLDLDARTVRVASAGALADLATLATPAERVARLAQNDGNTSDIGWISANTIRFAYPAGVQAGSGIAAIYVQNSGGAGAAARRGLTTGTGGVVIANFPTTDVPEVFINGRLQTSETSFVTGARFLASIAQVGTGAATDILVNGCVLASGVCGTPTGPDTSLFSLLAPPQDLIGVLSNSIDDDLDADTNKPGDPVPDKESQALVQFAASNPEQGADLTDDQVVGSGNDSLWTTSGGGDGGPGSASPFDTTIGIGNDAGGPGSTNGRAGAGGTVSSGAQRSGERAPGANQTGDGGVGIGNDAGPGGVQRGAGTRGAVGTPVAPAAPGAPAGVSDGSGGIGVGSDVGGTLSGATPGSAGNTTGGTPNNTNGRTNAPNGGPAAAGATTPGQSTTTGGDAGASGTLPGATQGAVGGSTNGTANTNGRATNSGGAGTTVGEQATGVGGDAGGTTAGGPTGTAAPADTATPTPGSTNSTTRQAAPTTPR